MTQQRKNAESRAKELRLAIYRIEHGRAHTKAIKLSVSAVAREAGVTPALIHNHYPTIAEEIRVKLGASIRQSRSAKQEELNREREKNKVLRKELEETKNGLAKLASINEVLLMEIKILRAKAGESKVFDLKIRT